MSNDVFDGPTKQEYARALEKAMRVLTGTAVADPRRAVNILDGIQTQHGMGVLSQLEDCRSE